MIFLAWSFIGVIIGDSCQLTRPKNFKQYILFSLLIGPIGIIVIGLMFVALVLVFFAGMILSKITKNINISIKRPIFIKNICFKFKSFYEN